MKKIFKSKITICVLIGVIVASLTGAIVAICLRHKHEYGNWETVTAATCTLKGEDKRTCSCGDVETRETDMLPHTYGSWTITLAADCETTGTKTHTCSVCSHEETETIDALGHTFADEWTSDDDQHWHEATCKHTDVKGDLANHNFTILDTCSDCGKVKRTDGLNFVALDINGVVTENPEEVVSFAVSGVGTAAGEGKIVINSTHNGKPVTTIAESFNESASSITEIIIPSTVTKIEDNAFSNSTSLTTITYEGTASEWKDVIVSDTGNNIITGSGTTIALTDGGVIDNSLGVALDAVKDSSGDVIGYIYAGVPSYSTDTNITIPSEYGTSSSKLPVTEIAPDAFKDNSTVTTITIPDSITNIGNDAFKNCDSLTTITIPSTVIEIGEGAFADCDQLTEIKYNGTTDAWQGIDGFDNVDQIIVCDGGTDGTAGAIDGKNDVVLTLTGDQGSEKYEVIGSTAGSTLDKVVIPSTIDGKEVATIADGAYRDNTNITSIEIPATVIVAGAIGENAFDGCTSLTEIKYNGTLAEFNTASGNMTIDAMIIHSEGVLDSKNATEYTTTGDSYQVSGTTLGTATDNTIVIPETIDGKNVTSIAANAYDGASGTITSITIPETIKGASSIGTDALAGLTGLTDVKYEGTAADLVEAGIFNAGLPNGVTTIECEDGTLDLTTYDVYTLINNGTEYAYAGSYSSNLTTVTILSTFNGKPVTEIAAEALKNNEVVEEVIIPTSIEKIGTDAFASTALQTLSYKGEMSDWLTLVENSEVTIDKDVHFVSGDKLLADGTINLGGIVYTPVTGSGDEVVGYTATGLTEAAQDDAAYTAVTIPVEVLGKPVTAIADNAFSANATGGVSGNSKIESITFAEGSLVTSIGANAFDSLEITEIEIPAKVETIGSNAFANCDSLTNITYDGTYENWLTNAASAGVPASSKVTCDDGVVIDMSSGLVYKSNGGTTPTYTVVGSTGSKVDIIIPTDFNSGSVTAIGEGAFDGASITSITIPDTVTEIGADAFDGCDHLGTVTYEGNAQNWQSATGLTNTALDKITVNLTDSIIVNGVIYTPVDDASISGTTVDSYTAIGLTNSASNDTTYTTIDIQDNIGGIKVDKIADEAFVNLENITTVKIPDSITGSDSIGTNAFAGSDMITTVEYKGDMATWDTVSDGAGINSSALAECNDGVVDSVNNLIYTKVDGEEDTYTVSSLIDTAVDTVVIPGTAENGIEVTAIGDSAFADTSITSITIPDTVEKIGDSAFAGTNLTEVKYEGSADKWGEIDISTTGNSNLTDIPVTPNAGSGASNEIVDTNSKAEYDKQDGGNGDYYVYDKVLSSVNSDTYVIPDAIGETPVTQIAAGAFAGNTSITTVTIPENITSIGDNAFDANSAITTVDYKGTIESWQTAIGSNNAKLESATVTCSNGVITGGNVYTNEGTELTYSGLSASQKDDTSNKAIVIPSEITTADGTTKTVTKVSADALSNNTTITSVEIPASVSGTGAIETGAFTGCTSLETITYDGTLENWQTAAGTVTTDANIICSDGAIDNKNDVKVVTNESGYQVVGTATGSTATGIVIIPEQIGGKNVTSIAANAYAGSTITSITIPETVKGAGSIAADAFDSRANLATVIYGGTAADLVEAGIFNAGLPNEVATIECEDGTLELATGSIYKEATGGDGYVFVGNVGTNTAGNATTVEIPTTIDGGKVTTIAAGAFSGNDTTTTVKIDATNIDTIEAGAFDNSSITAIEFAGGSVEEWIALLDGGSIPDGVTVTCENGTFSNSEVVINGVRYQPVTSGNPATTTYKVLGLTDAELEKEAPLSVVIVDTIGGIPVTEVADSAFSAHTTVSPYDIRNAKIESVTLGANLKTIGSRAFQATSITEISLSDTVEVGFAAFAHTKLVHADVKKDYDEGYTYANCASLQSVTIADGVTLIGSATFFSCSSLTSITIPESVTSIRHHALYTSSLVDINYLGSVETYLAMRIAANGIESISALVTCKDGYVDLPSRLAYETVGEGQNKTLTVSDTVITQAIYNIPVSIDEIPVTAINATAFAGNTSLQSLSIPAGVTSIEAGAFDGCTALTTITFNGSVEDWLKLAVDLPDTVSVTCENGKVVGTEVVDGNLRYVPVYSSEDKAEIVGYEVVGVTSAALDGSIAVTIPVNVLGKPVTAIADNAFSANATSGDSGNSKIESITFADGSLVTSIGANAFDSLEITEIEIPVAVETIGSNAFANCDSLTKIIYDDTVDNWQAKSLNSSIPTNLAIICEDGAVDVLHGLVYEKIGESSNESYSVNGTTTTDPAEITIPSSVNGTAVTAISDNAFENNTNLTTVTIPSTVTSIGTDAFSGTNVTTVNFNGTSGEWNSLVSTGGGSDLSGSNVAYTVQETHDGLVYQPVKDAQGVITGYEYFGASVGTVPTAVVIPSEIETGKIVTAIGESAFASNTSLTSVTIPATVTSIGTNAFNGCVKLATVTFGGTLEEWQTLVQAAQTTGGNGTLLNANVTIVIAGGSYVIKNGIVYEKLADGTYQANGLTEIAYADENYKTIIIPDQVNGANVTAIRQTAFSALAVHNHTDHARINSVTIGANVETIGSSAFNRTSITTITIPGKVKTIGFSAFVGTSLISVIIEDGVQGVERSIEAQAFSGCKDLTTMTIPATIKAIKTLSISDADGTVTVKPVTITFGGTVDQWISAAGAGTANLRIFARTGVTAPVTVNCAGGDVITFIAADTTQVIKSGIVYSLKVNNNLITSVSVSGLTEAAKTQSAITITETIGGTAIEAIMSGSFTDNTALTSIVIPASITAINANAFDGCVSLSTVTFGGTQTAWDTLTATAVTDGNGALVYATVYFDGGENYSIVYSKGVVYTTTGGTDPYTATGLTAAALADDNFTEVVIADELRAGIYPVVKVTSIANGAFCARVMKDDIYGTYGNTANAKLKSVTLGKNIATIGRCAFTDTEIDTVVFPDDGADMAISYAAFAFTKLLQLTIPGNVKSTEIFSFAFIDTLTSVDIKEGFTTLGAQTFINTLNIETLNIPASVTSIGPSILKTLGAAGEFANTKVTFAGTIDQWVNASGENLNEFSDKEGVTVQCQDASISILSATTIVYSIISIDEVDYWQSITSTGSGESAVTKIQFVVMRQSLDSDANRLVIRSSIGEYDVTTLGLDSFNGNSRITTLVLPETITAINEDAFADCTNLKTIEFAGTTTQWQDVKKLSGNDILDEVEIVCADKYIIKNGVIYAPVYDTTDSTKIVSYTVSGLTETGVENATLTIAKLVGGVAVTKIDDNALSSSKAIAITFEGSKDEWAANIAVGSGNTVLANTITCNDGTCDYVATSTLSYRSFAGDTFYGVTGITNADVAVPENIIIPGTYNGKPVEIIMNALRGASEDFPEITGRENYNNIKSVIIMNGITRIGNSAFRFTSLNKIVLPNTLTEMGILLFGGTPMTSIEIPASVVSFGYVTGGNNVFSESNIKDIYYHGTPQQWNSIKVSGTTNNDLFPMAVLEEMGITVHFVDENGYIFDELADGDFKFVGVMPSNTEKEIVIHKLYNDHAVTTIAANAFNGNSIITKVTITDAITTIEANAFVNCGDMTAYFDGTTAQWAKVSLNPTGNSDIAITCSNGVGYVGTDGIAFSNNSNLNSNQVTGLSSTAAVPTTLIISTKAFLNGTAYEIKAVGESAFRSNAATPTKYNVIEEVIILDGITHIYNQAFYNLTNLSKVTLPKTLVHLGSRAFDGCTSLTSIEIPNTMRTIADNCFTSSGLTDLYYHGTPNQWAAILKGTDAVLPNVTIHFVDENGISYKYNSNSTEFVATGMTEAALAQTTEIVIPSTYAGVKVAAVAADAFSAEAYSKITSLTISEGISLIGARAFSSFTGLETVYLPTGIHANDAIGSGIFANWGSTNGEAVLKVYWNVPRAGLLRLLLSNGELNIEMRIYLAENIVADMLTGLCYELNEAGTEYTFVGTKVYNDATAPTDVTIPDEYAGIKITALDNTNAAYGAIKILRIGANIKSIASNEFMAALNLTDIYYNGTYSDWTSIAANAGVKETVTVHCTDG